MFSRFGKDASPRLSGRPYFCGRLLRVFRIAPAPQCWMIDWLEGIGIN
jgi:hypothetical protein